MKSFRLFNESVNITGKIGKLKNLGDDGYWRNGVKVEIIDFNHNNKWVRIKRLDDGESDILCDNDKLYRYFEPLEDEIEEQDYEEWVDESNDHKFKKGDKVRVFDSSVKSRLLMT